MIRIIGNVHVNLYCAPLMSEKYNHSGTSTKLPHEIIQNMQIGATVDHVVINES